ncbi:hypothetical protein [Pseudoalteromonas sp. SA25]|uniref:hypothetical protein n=1 Tax=Pseudoalteromonas sp. SA25 TaxID=2686347 RepID=UPI0013FE4DD6|nr:hypothetical protein [Pseudoalteromonas sp. SA25]
MSKQVFKFTITLHEFYDKLDAEFETSFHFENNTQYVFISKEYGVIDFTVSDSSDIFFCANTKKPMGSSIVYPELKSTDKLKDLTHKSKVLGIITTRSGMPFKMQITATLEASIYSPKIKEKTSVEEKNIEGEIAETNMKIKLSRGFKL